MVDRKDMSVPRDPPGDAGGFGEPPGGFRRPSVAPDRVTSATPREGGFANPDMDE